jgi:MerR family transcriptional regulator, repressor of the yfmOP operon
MSTSKAQPISLVCRELELSPRTIRYYEELGLLPGVRRRNGGRRVYGTDEIERLRFIQKLKQLGLTLEEIAQLNAVYAIRGSTRAMLERLRELLDTRLKEIAAKVQDLQMLQSEMGNYLDRVEQRIGDLRAREEEKVYANSRS